MASPTPITQAKESFTFMTPDVKPDTLLEVFDQPFLVTKIDDDGSWSLVDSAKVQELQNQIEFAFLGNEEEQILAFKSLMSAVHNYPLDIKTARELIVATELADYYCSLPILSHSLYRNLLRGSSFVREIQTRSCALIETATKLRHDVLFKDCLNVEEAVKFAYNNLRDKVIDVQQQLLDHPYASTSNASLREALEKIMQEARQKTARTIPRNKTTNSNKYNLTIFPRMASTETPMLLDPITITTPGVKPDTRLMAFDQEFLVSSAALKMHYVFFRKFLDSPDKADKPTSFGSMKYSWITKLDEDKKGRLLLRSTYLLFSLTSALVYSNIFTSSMSADSVEILQSAYKRRKKVLFEQGMIYVLGPFRSPRYHKITDKRLREVTHAQYNTLLVATMRVQLELYDLCASYTYNTRGSNTRMAIKVSRPVIITLQKESISQDSVGETLDRNDKVKLVFYYRKIMESCDEKDQADLKEILVVVLRNDLQVLHNKDSYLGMASPGAKRVFKPITITTPEMRPDTRLRVFDQDFLVSSPALKMNSAFFRAFLDSPDKANKAPTNSQMKYSWTTKVDANKTGWTLVCETDLKSPDSELDESFFEGSKDWEIATFRILLLAIHLNPFVVQSPDQLQTITEHADYYRALPVFSLGLTSALHGSGQFARYFDQSNCIQMLEAAYKLRNRALYHDAMIYAVGPFDNPSYQTIQDKKLRGLAEAQFNKLCANIVKAQRLLFYVVATDINVAQEFIGHQIGMKMVKELPLSILSPEEPIYLAAYYRRILENCKANNSLYIEEGLEPLLKNEMYFKQHQIAGLKDCKDTFLCSQLSAEDLPWDVNDIDW
ncbi:hypothetical protein G7Y89_g6853 [Cudoniella acicularis]|uniref:BTB domain-containing protein n=1 Tax=Cudoniella acicularis TaxID=354080 RepID=A0A8H4RN45_9HELO|nr:hypothetical protein G7Y89_g6853 [Cudoniella acicularis]